MPFPNPPFRSLVKHGGRSQLMPSSHLVAGIVIGAWTVMAEPYYKPFPVGVSGVSASTKIVDVQCMCGRKKSVAVRSLLRSETLHCGKCNALQAVTLLPQQLQHRLHAAWKGMMNRCYNANNSVSWKTYGGRGIKVCKSWHNQENFIAWGKKLYEIGYHLDRRNPNADYSPNNCRWLAPSIHAQFGERRLPTMRSMVGAVFLGKKISLSKQWVLLCEFYGKQCAACGKQKLLSKDHIKPRSKGGNNLINNLQPLCLECNTEKSVDEINYQPEKHSAFLQSLVQPKIEILRHGKSRSSQYRGVSLNKKTGRYTAFVGSNSKQQYLGLFEDEIAAAQAYNVRAKELYGDRAFQNPV